jgi:antitoxin PrlF
VKREDDNVPIQSIPKIFRIGSKSLNEVRHAYFKDYRQGQVTIPKAIRETLHIEGGDYISYEVRDNEIAIKKISKADIEWARALNGTLSEWEDDLDDAI